MPNRILRDWTDSFRVERLSAEAERLFVRLIMKADDYGRFHADERLISAACYPLIDIAQEEIRACIAALCGADLIHVYTRNGHKYLSIKNFDQRLRAKRSRFPPPDGQPDDWSPPSDRHVTVKRPSNDGFREEKRREERRETKHTHTSEGQPGQQEHQTPTLEEVKAYAVTTGTPPAEAEAFFHHYEGVGWIDGAGRKVRHWRSKLVSWKINQIERKSSGKQPRRQGEYEQHIPLVIEKA